jgi:hypothetical protein
MRLLIFQTLMLVAVVVTGASLYSRVDDTVGGIISILLWIGVALGAGNIETYTQCCVQRTSEPLLQYFAIGMVGLSIIMFFFGSVKLFEQSYGGETE